MPGFGVIDFEGFTCPSGRRVGRKNREDFLASQIARSPVEVPLVSPGQSSLEATGGAEGRSWDKVFLSVKNGTDLFVKLEVGVGDGEGLVAGEAGGGHE